LSPHVAVEAVDVRKRFVHINALAGLSLSIYEGEIYGLLGPTDPAKRH
jgi:ABC-type multidrug transport system ATPase subunit